MALKSSEEFLRTALTNSTFDIDALDKALRKTLDTSFSYLYRLQRNTVIYEEYFYTTQNVEDQPDYGDLYLDKIERVCVNIPVELILTNAREAYRKSYLYNTEIPIDTIEHNHVIFGKLPVIILDNQVLKDFSVRIYDGYFTVITPFRKDYIYDRVFNDSKWNYNYIEHTISVQIINNTFYTDLETNTGMLRKNGFDNSFDRIKKSYVEGSKVDLKSNYTGILFAVLFLGDTKLGTLPQEVTVNEDGDYIVNYDDEVKALLNDFTGTITIRFIFYRYLYRHHSYHYDGSDANTGLVNIREKDESVQSEMFLISDKDDKLYGMPVPTENLLIYKRTNGDTTKVQQFPNKNVIISYPNIYRVKENVTTDDQLDVYYFYIPPYDLTYTYMYQFYYAYMKHKWKDYTLEKIVNMIYFGDYDFTDDSMLKELPDPKKEEDTGFEDPEGCRRGLYYEWESKPEDRWKTHQDLKDEFNKEHGDEEDTNYVEGMTDEEKAEYLEKMKPIRLKDFQTVFDFIIDRPITEYQYDEIDYTKKYMDTTPPLEYRTNKLQEFINDNFNALHDYILAQKQVTYKYEFTREEVNLEARYSEVNGAGAKLVEPCYLFTISKEDPDEMLTARIFVDGIFIANFIYERYTYNDHLYLPVDLVPEDAQYFEIEVFPAIVQRETVTFTTEKPSVTINFESTSRIDPTLSDLFFYYGTDPTNERIPSSSFRLEVVSKDYNYLVNPAKLMDVYKIPDKKQNAGAYYDEHGHYYTRDGQRTEKKDITEDRLQEMVAAGDLVADSVKETSNLMEIERDNDYRTFDDLILDKKPIINRENKGVNFTILRTIKITALDADAFGEELTIAIAKSPYFFTKTAQNICFPMIDVHAENLDPISEYTRVFKDGRLRSRNRYDFKYYDGKLQVRTLEALEKRATLTVDVTPYRNRLVFYQDELSSDLVDLAEYIDKPFDIRYYDVYLNGRKLNRTNIFPISPYEIKLCGIHSIYNLEVYERDRDWEYFDLSFDKYFTLSNLIDKSFMEKVLKNDLIHDITGDVPGNDNTEKREPWSRENDGKTILFSLFYYNMLVFIGHLDPEQKQLNKDEIMEKYDIIDQMYRVQNDNGEDVYLFNPDLYYKPDNDSSKERWRVYLLGNRDPEELDQVPEKIDD